jgi:hypothetical protein
MCPIPIPGGSNGFEYGDEDLENEEKPFISV